MDGLNSSSTLSDNNEEFLPFQPFPQSELFIESFSPFLILILRLRSNNVKQ